MFFLPEEKYRSNRYDDEDNLYIEITSLDAHTDADFFT